MLTTCCPMAESKVPLMPPPLGDWQGKSNLAWFTLTAVQRRK